MNAKPRGRPPQLSRDAIVAAARQLADEEGLEALTVRKVAQLLGGGQASLYRHIADRGELLLLLAQDVAVHLPVDDEAGASLGRMVAFWGTAHEHLAGHAWMARIIAEGEYVLDEAAPFATSALRGLEDLGLAQADAVQAYRAIWNMMLGYLLNAHPVGHTATHGESGEARSAPDRADNFAWALERLLRGVLRAPSEGATAAG